MGEYWFEPNYQTWYMSIQATYPADFIEITYMVQQIRQFKLYSSLLQVNIHLHIEYSQITNQILLSFSSTVQMF